MSGPGKVHRDSPPRCATAWRGTSGSTTTTTGGRIKRLTGALPGLSARFGGHSTSSRSSGGSGSFSILDCRFAPKLRPIHTVFSPSNRPRMAIVSSSPAELSFASYEVLYAQAVLLEQCLEIGPLHTCLRSSLSDIIVIAPEGFDEEGSLDICSGLIAELSP